MVFTNFFIKRPVFATAMSLLLVLIGIISYSKLTIRQFPEVDANIINIQTTYPGASAALMESFVTTPIENALTGISNLDYMTSTSSSGDSEVTLNLALNSDINDTMLDVQSKLSRVIRKLPDGVNAPVISEVSSDNRPSMIILFSSPNRSAAALTDYLTRTILPDLGNINGVAQVRTLGNRTYAMRIWLNVNKMQALNISSVEVENALKEQNVQATPGEITRTEQVVNISAQTDLHTANQFNNLVIKKVGKQLIRLKNIGKVELGAQDTTSSLYANGKEGVGVGVSYKSDANPLSTAIAVKKALSSIRLPNDIHASIASDNSVYIEKSIEEVLLTFAITIILVILVIFVFLGSLRLVLIPLVTIPLSITGAFVIMAILNYSINTLTLLAFVLAIGMVVDDAIVVMENIHRNLIAGMSAMQAAMLGTKQIAFAVIGMTITLMAVYAPIGFTSGLTGALFREFVFTLAGAVLVSGLIALMLSPMMCSKLLNSHSYKSGLAKKIDHGMDALSQNYKKLLSLVLEQKWLVLFVMLTVFIAGAMFMLPLSKTSGIAPQEDQGKLFAIADGPSSASINYTSKYTNEIGKIFSTVPEKKNYVIINGMFGTQNQGFSILSLKDWSQRKRTPEQIINSIQNKINAIPGISTFLTQPSSLPGSKALYPFQFVITTTSTYQELANTSNKIVTEASRNPMIRNINADLNFDQPELVIKINRDKAGYLGISMNNIDSALQIALGQPQINEFSLNGYAYYVIPQLSHNQYDTSNILNRITVRTDSGKLIPLSTLISLNRSVTTSSFNHFQGQRAVIFNVQLASNYSTQQAINYFIGLAKKTMTGDMSYAFSGQTRLYMQTKRNMLMIFVTALLIIFLVLAAQFESFRDPIIILVTVPLAITGALGTLFFTGDSLNIYTEIGLVTLIGLISCKRSDLI